MEDRLLAVLLSSVIGTLLAYGLIGIWLGKGKGVTAIASTGQGTGTVPVFTRGCKIKVAHEQKLPRCFH